MQILMQNILIYDIFWMIYLLITNFICKQVVYMFGLPNCGSLFHESIFYVFQSDRGSWMVTIVRCESLNWEFMAIELMLMIQARSFKSSRAKRQIRHVTAACIWILGIINWDNYWVDQICICAILYRFWWRLEFVQLA